MLILWIDLATWWVMESSSCFQIFFFFFSINIDCCLRVSPEGLNLCESRCGNTSRAPGESTWKSSAAHWSARPDLTRWPSLFKQLVLLRWEQPPESLAGFRFLFLSVPHPSEGVTSPGRLTSLRAESHSCWPNLKAETELNQLKGENSPTFKCVFCYSGKAELKLKQTNLASQLNCVFSLGRTQKNDRSDRFLVRMEII